MTLQTWKDEFYPKPPTKRMSKRKAIEHSLRKWEGLTKRNLKKHGCFAHSGDVGFRVNDDTEFGYEWFRVDADNCSLCVKYLDYEKYDENMSHCTFCPLAHLLGKPCDRGNSSPFSKWVHSHNPYPMIRALRKLLDAEEV